MQSGGWLNVKWKGKNWKKKYCLIQNEHLLLTKNDPKNPTNFFIKEKISLLSSTIKQEEDYFYIIPLTQQKYEFKGESSKEVAEWLSSLHSSLRRIHSKELLFAKIEEADLDSLSSLLKLPSFLKKERMIDEENERTVLHYGAKRGSVEVMNLLLEYVKEEEGGGMMIDINQADNQGWTALGLAVRYNHMEIVNVLLKHGADPHPSIPLMYNNSLLIAVDLGYSSLVQTLLHLGAANINTSDGNGGTALHIASDNCDPDMVLFLIENGANVNSVDSYGQSPLSLASAHFPSKNSKIVIAILASSLEFDSLSSLSLHPDVLTFIRDSSGEDEYVAIYRKIRRTRRYESPHFDQPN